MNKKQVVITGIGPMCSLGLGKELLWQSICEGKTNLVNEFFPIGDGVSGPFYLHKMPDFDIQKIGFDPETLKWIHGWKGGYVDMDLIYLAAAVKLAIDDSKLKYNPRDYDVGLVLTHENPGLENLFDAVGSLTFDFAKRENKSGKKAALEFAYSKCETLGYDMQTFMYPFFVAKLFEIHGFSIFINNACASGLYALELAAQQIILGKCRAVIVAGADRPRMAYKHLWFQNNHLYAADGLIKPFAKNRNGFVFGDAATGIVLESYESATERGAHIYAEYAGGGFTMECSKVMVPAVGEGYYKDAMLLAMKSSRVDECEIDLVVPHGIGTAITDLHEARTIEDVFRKKPDIAVTALKPFLGHNLGGCALLETALILLAMENGMIPPTLNSSEIDPKINIQLVTKPTSKKLSVVMKTACGFAGYNGASIFRKI